MMPRMTFVACLILSLLSGSSCSFQGVEADVRVLFDFETDQELDRLSWACRVIYARDQQHATRGRYSLRVEVYPDDYPGFKTTDFRTDWRGYARLEIDVFNPLDEGISLAYRMDDRQDGPPHADRANGSFFLEPGPNALHMDLASLRTSGTNRPLAVGHVHGLYLFLVRPAHPVTLFLDNIRLVR